MSQYTYVWAPLTFQGGWTVADTARPERITTMRNSNNSCKSKIEPSTPANVNQQQSCLPNSYNTVHVQDRVFPNQVVNNVADKPASTTQLSYESVLPNTISHQEELDKLLAGLDKLTETLPDLACKNSVFNSQLYNDKPSSYDVLDASIENPFKEKLDKQTNEVAPLLSEEANNFIQNNATHINSKDKYADELLCKGKVYGDNQNSQECGQLDNAVSENNIKPSEIQKHLKQLNSSSGLPSIENNLKGMNIKSNMQPVSVVDYNSQPYHTRTDSKPFSYIRSLGGSSKASSRNISRASSKETLSQPGGIGLESPSLLRKILDVNGSNQSYGSRPMSPNIISSRSSPAPPAISIGNNNARLDFQSPSLVNKTLSSHATPQFSAPFEASLSSHNTAQNIYNFQSSTLLSPSVVPIDPSVTLQHRSSTNMQINSNGSIIASDETKHSSKLIEHMNATDEEASLTWLQKQQKKLKERRDNQRRRESRDRDGDMMHELKTSLTSARLDGKPFIESNNIHTSQNNKLSSSINSISSLNQSMISQLPVVKNQTIPSSSIMNDTPSYHQYEYRKKQQSIPHPTQQLLSPSLLQRQKSDTSYDRQRPIFGGNRRMRYDSESEANTTLNTNSFMQPSNSYYQHPRTSSTASIDSSHVFMTNGGSSCNNSLPNSRPITPGFPCSAPTTPYFNQSSNTLPYNSIQQQVLQRVNGIQRSSSPAGVISNYGALTPRRGSISSTRSSEQPAEVSASHVKRTKDSHRFWYKPNISREEAIGMLRVRSPGSFIVRDSNSFPGAFGLALKVATLPSKTEGEGIGIDPTSEELVRHFLIEPTKKGVKLKGYTNEPVFSSLSALVYQHTVTPLALPTTLTLPQGDVGSISSRDSIDSKMSSSASQMQQLLAVGAACNVMYLFSASTDTLTGPKAIQKTITQFFILSSSAAKDSMSKPSRVSNGQTLVHFKVSSQGITLTDNARRLFFRKHYNTQTISFCGIDPDDRKWNRDEKVQDTKHVKHSSNKDRSPSISRNGSRIFGFIARKPTSRSGHNQCHIFAEQDSDQPARAIVNFVNKVLASNNQENSRDQNKHTDVV